MQKNSLKFGKFAGVQINSGIKTTGNPIYYISSFDEEIKYDKQKRQKRGKKEGFRTFQVEFLDI